MDQLWISENPALERIDLGALERIDLLTVSANALLPPAAFDGVQIDELAPDAP